jgi:organic hydroperoxide reductase OsmC/OhrA
MAGREHTYRVSVEWTGDDGAGTTRWGGYRRDHTISAQGKADILGSSDPAFRGNPTRWNPEELLLASISACHKLWYLHLCAVNRVVVTAYLDRAEGVMAEDADGGGRFVSATLRPQIVIAQGSDPERAKALHHDAHEKCFIANSVNFEIAVEPQITVGG